MADEVNEAFKVIRDRLKDVAALGAVIGLGASARIYAEDQVPQSPTFPYVLIEYIDGRDFNGTGTRRISTNTVMRVTLINKGPIDANMRAADREMDGALQTTVRTQSGGHVFSARRVRPYRRPLLDAANNKYQRTGGDYQLLVA